MGRNQHSKDRLFITATEWAVEYGGKKRERVASRRPLPYDCCALSLQPYESPIATADGVVFDVLRIMPFLKKHKVNPVDGAPLRAKDLVPLHMHKNAAGAWHCPVTFKVFNENTRIVCVKPSGHVYAYEAVHELNVKAKNWKDLMTDAPFAKKDLIMLQDPSDDALNARRDLANFVHLQTMREQHAAAVAATPASAHIRATPGTAALFKQIEAGRGEAKAAAAVAKRAAAAHAAAELDALPDLAALRRLKPTVEDLFPGSQQTGGGASHAFTSSGVAVDTTSKALRLATVEEMREARWKACRVLGKKGYVQLQTNHGNLNLEVHSDFTPRTAENFLGLCARGAYDGVPFHRLIKGFMLQGGDTTSGDGTGGKTLWTAQHEQRLQELQEQQRAAAAAAAAATGGPSSSSAAASSAASFTPPPPPPACFPDEFDSRLVHGGRGVVSMANSGRDRNTSQFFLCFRAARHLDNVHTIFAKVVGGMAVLDRIEQCDVDPKTDRPKARRGGEGGGGEEGVVVLKATVFSDPLAEATAAVEAAVKGRQEARAVATSERSHAARGGRAGPVPEGERQRRAAIEARDRKGWHSRPTPDAAEQPTSSASSAASAAPSSSADADAAAAAGASLGVGKYLKSNAAGASSSASFKRHATTLALAPALPKDTAAAAAGGTAANAFKAPLESRPAKKRATGMAFGDFSGW